MIYSDLTRDHQPRIFLAARDVLTSSQLALSVSENLFRIESLVLQYGIDPVLDAFDRALCGGDITTPRRMCVLIALQYTAMLFGSPREILYRDKIQALISTDRLDLSICAFSTGVVGYVYNNRADQAVEWLVDKFEWLRANRVCRAASLNIAGAYVCKEFGQFDLALQFSYLAYADAFHAEDELSIMLANYFVLNTHRLSTGNSNNLQGMFDQEVRKLQSGQINLGVHSNYLLPVYAASQEVETAKPNIQRVERMLSLASELGDSVDGNCRASWAAAKGFLELHRGNNVQAKNYLHQSEALQQRADATLEPLRQKLRLGLGMRAAPPVLSWTPASSQAWRELHRCASLQSSFALSG